jgi:hypothetical protein
MNTPKIRNRFHIYTGVKQDNTVLHARQAGEAYEVETDRKPHYIVKMWAFPQNTYYLAKNLEGDDRFTLFAKRMGDGDNVRFRRPVGYGLISRDLRQYLEIQFAFPREKVFMSLFPSEITYDSLLTPSGGIPCDS